MIEIQKIADKFGKEEPIVMTTEDPRYIYYNWIVRFFGMTPYYGALNKCPMYQTIFWGSMLLLVISPFLLLGKITEVLIGYPIIALYGIIDVYNEKIGKMSGIKRLLMYNLVLGIILATGLLFIKVVSPLKIIMFFGLTITVMMAIPAFLAVLAYMGLSFILTFDYPWGLILIYFIYTVAAITLAWLIIFKVIIKWMNTKSGKKVVSKVKEWPDKLFLFISKKFSRSKKSKKEKVITRPDPVPVKTFNTKPYEPIKFLTIFKPIIIFLKTLWDISAEIVSNHCPPVDIYEIIELEVHLYKDEEIGKWRIPSHEEHIRHYVITNPTPELDVYDNKFVKIKLKKRLSNIYVSEVQAEVLSIERVE